MEQLNDTIALELVREQCGDEIEMHLRERIRELEKEVEQLTKQCQEHNTRQTNLHKQWREKYEKLEAAFKF